MKFLRHIVVVLLVIAPATATAMPAYSPINPWTSEKMTESETSRLTEVERLFRAGLEKLDSRTTNSDQEAESLLGEAARKGSLQAELVYLAHWAGRSAPEKILRVFQEVDSSTDPKILYEAGKLMQLRYALCLNVLDENDQQSVTRACSVGNNRNPLDQTTNYAETERLLLARQLRSTRYIVKAAMLGYPPAQFEVGYRIYYKRDIPEEILNEGLVADMRSESWLEKAVQAGHPQAGTFLKLVRQETRRADAEKEREAFSNKERERTRPKCNVIIFTGIATASDPSVIKQILASKDVEDTLARNPIRCSSSCYGAGYFQAQKARILDWNKDYFMILAPVDFNTGRRDISLAIRRRDAVCSH